MNITGMLIEQAGAIGARPLPPDVEEAARHALLDWCAIAIAGANEPLVTKLRDEAREQGGHPLSTVLLHGERTSPAYAALINGSSADALDFSDANFAMRGHTTPAVVATAMALGESRDISGHELLRAIVTGIETECRVGLLVRVPHLRKGFHPTGNLAPFGATAAAAQILALTPKQWANALGTAATQAAGLHTSGGTMSKPFHSGKAAMTGLLSASLAKRDWVARENAIEADGGFLETHATGIFPDELANAADRYFILETIYKSHAACQLTHSTIENMLDLKTKHGVTPDAIESADLRVPKFFLGVCNIQDPASGLEAKFSLRAVAAMTLLGDDTRDIASYNVDAMKRESFVQLHKKMRVTGSDDLDGGVAVSDVRLTNGTTLTVTNDCYLPMNDLPAQRDVLVRKYEKLVPPVLGAKRAETLLMQILDVHHLPSIRPLIALAVKDR